MSDIQFYQEYQQWEEYLSSSPETNKKLDHSINVDMTGDSKMADYSNLYASESKFLKADDLKGRAIKVFISDAKVEPMTQDPNGDRKLVIYFQGKEKGMALNKTNFNVLSSKFGADSDAWMGKEIEVFSMDVEYQGKLVPGLRLRVLEPATAEFDDDIPF